MAEYEENFIETFSGNKFHYLEPSFDEIHIEDIAHALSLKCRFSGHCREFYSVAEPSIRVAQLVPLELRLEALLHDAAEAYMPDVPRPIKNKFALRKFEDVILRVIFDKYAIRTRNSSIVKWADDVLIATEARDLMPNMNGWANLAEPLESTICPQDIRNIRSIFLELFKRYGGKQE